VKRRVSRTKPHPEINHNKENAWREIRVGTASRILDDTNGKKRERKGEPALAEDYAFSGLSFRKHLKDGEGGANPD